MKRCVQYFLVLSKEFYCCCCSFVIVFLVTPVTCQSSQARIKTEALQLQHWILSPLHHSGNSCLRLNCFFFFFFLRGCAIRGCFWESILKSSLFSYLIAKGPSNISKPAWTITIMADTFLALTMSQVLFKALFI